MPLPSTVARDAFDVAVRHLRDANRIVFFTGAGISTESGIPSFRDEGGFWQHFPPEQFATAAGLLETFEREPRRVAEFLVAFLEPVVRATPNAAHRAIAQLERRAHVVVVTQNVDGLHQEAGSKRVREVHGSIFDVVSSSTGRLARHLTRAELGGVVTRLRALLAGNATRESVESAAAPLVAVASGGVTRPRLVLFGEPMCEPDWSTARTDAGGCDVMIVVGTSAMVMPAAELPYEAKRTGAPVIVIDPNETFAADAWLAGRAGEILPELVAALG